MSILIIHILSNNTARKNLIEIKNKRIQLIYTYYNKTYKPCTHLLRTRNNENNRAPDTPYLPIVSFSAEGDSDH